MNNEKAENLFNYYKNEIEVLDKKLKKFKKSQKSRRKELDAIYQEAIKACKHPDIRIESEYDYHNNVDWERHICNVCGKTVKRI